MTLLTKDDLVTLIESGSHSSHCVSIYLPTHRQGRAIQQDRLRLRNLIGQAENGLRQRGLNQPAARAILRPARRLLRDSPFWRSRQDGLALFLSEDAFQIHRLPCGMPEFWFVGERFYIKPLLSMLTQEAGFLILALSRESVQLYQATRWSIEEVPVQEALRYIVEIGPAEEAQKQVQFHTGTQGPGGQGKRPAVFYGQGDRATEDKAKVLRYYQQIDGRLGSILRQENLPLVLVGVEYLVSIYRQVNSYPHLRPESVSGSPERWIPAEIHTLALQVVEPVFTQARDEANSRFRKLTATGSALASNDLRSILPAAHHGRVEVLFLASGERQWGNYHPGTGSIELHETQKTDSEELLDLSAVYTLLNDGLVYNLKPGETPALTPAAAILRF